MAVDGAAGALGRSDAFLTSSKCPSPSCRGQGCQETAKDGGCLMRMEEEMGKGLLWPLRGSGTFLTWSCCVLAAGEVAEGGRVGPGGPTPQVCVLSQAHGELGQGIVLGLWGNLLCGEKLIPTAGSHILHLLLWTVATAASGQEGAVSSRWNHS